MIYIKTIIFIAQILITIMSLFGTILFITGKKDSAIYVATFTIYAELVVRRIDEK